MRYNLLFFLLAIVITAIAVIRFCFPSLPSWTEAALFLLAGVLLVMIWVVVVRPIRTLTAGMDLVSAQDFGSRLSRVGYPDADRLVDMFNRMMTCLKNERLRQHEQNTFLSLLIEASPMGIVIFDFDGRLSLINPAALRLLDIPAGHDLTGLTLEMIPGDIAAMAAAIPKGETRILRPADTQVYRCARLSFMEMGFPRPFLLIESLTDEISRAEKAAYEKVIRMISHEVNNSMAGIKSLLETLADIMEGDPAMAELIDSCHERCVSMSRFITSYADVVKLPDPTPVMCDLNTAITRQLPFLEAMLPEGIKLTFTPSPESAPAMADSVQLEQVMVNIVKNAAESILSAPGATCGEIGIAISSAPSSITITDNGPGISSDTAAHLFTPFFTTKPSGQGIGLLCVSEILRRHRCRFSLVTVAPLTRFTIIFPDR